MRKRYAPTHDLLARMRYVPEDDTAWRHELVDSECAAIRDKYDPETGHPFWLYFTGQSRFDLEDPAIAPYLDMSASPEIWRFRRLPREERNHIAYLVRANRLEEAWSHAFAHGVVGLDNPGNETGHKLAALLAQSASERTDRQRKEILRVAEDYAAALIPEVGAACFRGSQDLTALEKKP